MNCTMSKTYQTLKRCVSINIHVRTLLHFIIGCISNSENSTVGGNASIDHLINVMVLAEQQVLQRDQTIMHTTEQHILSLCLSFLSSVAS